MINKNIENEERNFDFVKNFYRALKYWYIIPIFLFLSTSIAVYLYKTTTPMYKISTRLLISDGDSRNMTSISGGAESGRSLPGVVLGGQNNLENQLIVLTSYRQIERALKQLDFGISYYKKGIFLTNEIYKSSPFKVVIDTTMVKIPNKKFNMDFVSKDEFVLTIEGDDNYKRNCRFFEKIVEPEFVFTIVPANDHIEGEDYVSGEYCFMVNSLRRMVLNYQAKLRLDRINMQSSIIEVSLVENNPQKGVDFLNTLAQMSVNYTLEKKNQVAINTINFIEKQLIGVMDSLSVAEKVLEDFRSHNEVMDVSMQGQMIIQQSQDLENQRATVILRLDYYNYLIDYLEANRNVQELKFPSVMGVDDPTLTALISELSTLNAERSSLQFNSKEVHPQVIRIDKSISSLKNSIVENTRNIIATTNMTLKDLDQRIMQLSSQIRRLPRTEQMLLGIQRKFELTDGMYTYLMERRSDALLAKAANVPDNEIIEEAIPRGLVAPDKKRIVIIVILLGLFLPCIVIFLIIFFNDKIQDKEDLEAISQKPIIGLIPNQKKLENNAQLFLQPRSGLAEAFRAVRTSLGFFASSDKNLTYLVTSTIPGEGKTFCAVNLAISFAKMNKKTLLIGYDLRKPTIQKYFSDNLLNLGIGDYYANPAEKLKIQQDSIDNLYLLFPGTLPPNPSELISSEKTEELFEKLKAEYEVIIVDSSPLALVSDTHLLTKFSDVNILVVRYNHTPKAALKQCLQDVKISSLTNLNLLLNGIPMRRGDYSSYYGYGKGYYFD
jgi:capsular exopolysaccharide synthesis family protein